jgi:exodeoxyribonuclease VII small subunit
MDKSKKGDLGGKENLTATLKELSKIVDWFEGQDEVDVEEGLKQVKRGAELIKSSKKRLAEVENEFKEIQKEIEGDLE